MASNLACQATFVAIGPGGQGSRYYGGGSGNVEYVVIDISSSEYEVTIGGCAYPYQDHDICVTIPKGKAIICVDQGDIKKIKINHLNIKLININYLFKN